MTGGVVLGAASGFSALTAAMANDRGSLGFMPLLRLRVAMGLDFVCLCFKLLLVLPAASG